MADKHPGDYDVVEELESMLGIRFSRGSESDWARIEAKPTYRVTWQYGRVVGMKVEGIEVWPSGASPAAFGALILRLSALQFLSLCWSNIPAIPASLGGHTRLRTLLVRSDVESIPPPGG